MCAHGLNDAAIRNRCHDALVNLTELANADPQYLKRFNRAVRNCLGAGWFGGGKVADVLTGVLLGSALAQVGKSPEEEQDPGRISPAEVDMTLAGSRTPFDDPEPTHGAPGPAPGAAEPVLPTVPVGPDDFVVAFTGTNRVDFEWCDRVVEEKMRELKTLYGTRLHILTGMSMGVDMAVAKRAQTMRIRYTALVAFPDQAAQYSPRAHTLYKDLLLKAANSMVLGIPGYDPAKFVVRNRIMAQACNLMVVVWDYIERGITWAAVEYARKAGKEVQVIAIPGTSPEQANAPTGPEAYPPGTVEQAELLFGGEITDIKKVPYAPVPVRPRAGRVRMTTDRSLL